MVIYLFIFKQTWYISYKIYINLFLNIFYDIEIAIPNYI